ncbi:hypothetical protein BSIN_1109 [Burkholderia singularis]|uniref:Uncharacterized protein n=1 Tax=Burkholderia singularis TaxID=1503053 RepID=A0A238HDM6_9BURK|nr:hypothetical protein BSIN_1109 [Burkholderia singularis]
MSFVAEQGGAPIIDAVCDGPLGRGPLIAICYEKVGIDY